MKPRNKTAVLQNRKFVDVHDLCEYVALGRNSAVRLAKAANAERQFGKRKIYDLTAIDEYFDKQAKE